MKLDTIAAIATPPGAGGIGIVRLSGPDALVIGARLFRFAGKKTPADPASFTSHKLHFGSAVSPDGRFLDEALCAVMKGPNSYTGEDVVEFQCHGGSYLLRTLLGHMVDLGARLADPGEFTKRAFLSGRMDLTQAESVMDLIDARTKASHRMAANLFEGALGSRVGEIRERLLSFSMEIAAEIDFPEDVEDVVDCEGRKKEVTRKMIPPLRDFISRHEDGQVLRDGVRLAIVGLPNVGKSSIMNCLAERERSIVTELPGTTRDLVEESLNLSGIPFVVTDTAGIRDTDDQVEKIGVDLAMQKIASADLVLFVVDLPRILDAANRTLYEEVKERPHMVVVNKTDLGDVPTPRDLFWPEEAMLTISALTGDGIDVLRKAISKRALPMEIGGAAMPNLRQKKALEEAVSALERLAEGLSGGAFFDLLAVDLNAAIHALGLVTGESVEPDLLDLIFSEFCIGK